ncbi:hypothetical protein PSA7680_03285 [Pseudoruegeria aquimaris]|uniref:Immunoglobulin A1 protease autotransporter n=1 Tax=Pseudoruegeria aquimaris TaxID=393663 RepID=A0A1Y5THV2_9RHOB|nr:energy transducer TonB [Pseudoruegeria aquimaris]SLN62455.1 hypothetical protein PSA7680_03285 [Pseudoruegeria aquimaris]
MALNTGQKISGVGHVALIGWMFFGGWLSQDALPEVEVAEVSLISGEEFAQLFTPQPVADAPLEAAPEVPQSEPDAPEAPEAPAAAPQPEAAAPEETPRSEPAVPDTPDAPDAAPDLSELAPAPEAEVADAPPPAPVSPSEDVAVLLPNAPQSSPKPAPRVAPQPTPEPSPEATIDTETRQEAAPVPEPEAEIVQEAQEATAPEESSTRIVTEAEEQPETAPTPPPSAAPVTSARPPARPPRPTRAAEAPQPASAPAQEPAPDNADQAAVDAAVAAALAGLAGGGETAPASSSAPAGPPLSSGEKDSLIAQISQCWNVGSLSTEALKTTVTLAVAMTREAKPEIASIRMIGYEGGDEAAARQAYEAARRAIIRCGAKGFALPSEKYDHWREIEMVFNPEKMRFK